MIEILTWFIMSYGLMNIMVYGSIFSGFRKFFSDWGSSGLPFHRLGNFISGILSCPMCFSVWGGFFLGFLIYSPTHELFSLHQNISWFFDGILSSGAVWVINAIIEWFEQNRPNNNNQII